MRTRITADPEVSIDFQHWSKYVPTGATTYWGTSTVKESGFRECITDDEKTRYVQYGSFVRRRVFKAVTHEVWSATYGNGQEWVFSTTDHKNMEKAGGAMILAYDYYPSGGTRILGDAAYSRAMSTAVHNPVDYGHYNRWQNVKPTMATRANLGVFLYELRDFTRMWDFIPQKHLLIKGLTQRTLTWGTFRQWWKRMADDNPAKTPGQLAEYLNSQHLNYNFGWKPFISDIRKCWRGLESFEERLARFKRDALKELRKRFRDSPRLISLTTDNVNPGFTRYNTLQTWDMKDQHASAFDFSYSIPQYSEEEIRWRALADSLGVKLGPSTFWAVVPWSFVGDWFINVGGFLQAYESDWLQPWVNLHQGCYSRKISGVYTASVKVQPAYGSGTFPGITMQCSQYIRKVGLPNFSAATDPLDADKIRLGASLLLSLFQR